MGALSPTHILILLVIVVLIFGASRVPKLGRSMGEGIRGFKEGVAGNGLLEEPAEPVVTRVAAGEQAKPDVVSAVGDEIHAVTASKSAGPAPGAARRD
jgi:sec-independent protein translocase protein TatA